MRVPISQMARFARGIEVSARLGQRLWILRIDGTQGFRARGSKCEGGLAKGGGIGVNRALHVIRALNPRNTRIIGTFSSLGDLSVRYEQKISRLDERQRILSNRQPFRRRAGLLLLRTGGGNDGADRSPEEICGRIDLSQHEILNGRDGQVGRCR